MDLITLYGISFLFFAAFLIGRLKTQFFNMQDSDEMIKQSVRCYEHDFNKKSQKDDITLPSTDGCKVVVTEDGVQFTSQTRLIHSSIL